MPPLPVVSGIEAKHAFEKVGWKFDRQKGSHMILIKEKCYPLTIPDHKELARGTLRGLLRHAGISVEDFLKLLNK